MKLSNTEATLRAAALKAGMDEKTARAWRQRGLSPGETKQPRHYRTRPDPFAEVWPELALLLAREPGLEALTLFAHLQRQYPDRFTPGQVRTLQRRRKAWRAEHGPPHEVFFPQRHVPGRQGQSDFTNLNELPVTIAGQPCTLLF